MSRKIRLLFSPALALLLVASGLGPGVNSSAQSSRPKTQRPQGAVPGKQRPNFVLIVTDDQRWDTLPYMPKLQQRLAARGMVFENAFVTTPRCCPSRASILTGLYAHNTGVLRNGPPQGGVESFKDPSTLATWLQAAGYRTALIGKYLNGYEKTPTYVPPGWDAWQGLASRPDYYYNHRLSENGKIVKYGAAPDEYSTDVYAAKAVAFLKSGREKPFFLFFAPSAPHAPAIPASRHQAVAVPDPRRPPNYDEANVSDKPEWVRSSPRLPRKAGKTIDEFRKKQLRSLLAVDDAIDTICQALEELGKLDDTLILFTSDNGYAWGEHRQRGKQSAYEESIRVPFVVFYPRWTRAPRQEKRIALNIDIAPTLAELAGISPPAKVNGRSIVPLLAGRAINWRSDFLLEYWGSAKPSRRRRPDGRPDLPTYAGVRTERWKYLEFMNGERELYDLVQDPYEMENLATQSKYALVQEKLATRLQKLKRE